MIKRLFIDSDVLHEDELHRVQRKLHFLLKRNNEPISDFDAIIDMARFNLEATWSAIKEHDEIYADSSLLPLVGGTSIGAPAIMHSMLKQTIKEKIEGKSLILMRPCKDIEWDNVNLKLLHGAFKQLNNRLFTLEYIESVGHVKQPLNVFKTVKPKIHHA